MFSSEMGKTIIPYRVLADRNLLPIEIEDEEVNGGLISPAYGGGYGHAVFGGNPVFGRLDGAGRLHHALGGLANDLAPSRPMPTALMACGAPSPEATVLLRRDGVRYFNPLQRRGISMQRQ